MVQKLTDKKAERLKKLPHIIAGAIILLHSYERFETGHSTYIFFLVAGIVFLGLAIFHHSLTKKFRYIDTLFYIIEGLLSFLIAYEYFHAGKKGLPVVYILAGLLQFFATFVFVSKNRGTNFKSKH